MNKNEADSAHASLAELRARVDGTTINNITLLSTDYLNHFNELVMMLELAADMPEMLEDVADWHPKTYEEHFRDSSFQHKELAIEAYSEAPPEYRLPLRVTIRQINDTIAETLPVLMGLSEATEDPEASGRFAAECSIFTQTLRELLERAGAIINGAAKEAELAVQQEEETEAAEVMNQSSIDALFD